MGRAVRRRAIGASAVVVLLSGAGAAAVWFATGSWWALALLAVGVVVDTAATVASVPHLRERRRRPLVRIWVAAHVVGLLLAAVGLAVWLLR